jgi:predicted nucleotide-binding protein (sugar kinase/HSP70/actin superfamily)
MGTLHIVLKALLTAFGQTVLAPPPVTKETLELGAKYAPETACLPFKINLGNFIQALEQGADTILTCGGVGPCRLGYYAEIQKSILRDLGYKFEMIVVEPNIANVWQGINQLAYGRSWREIYQAFRLAGAKMRVLDALERQMGFVRPREKPGSGADAVWRQAMETVDRQTNVAAVLETGAIFRRRLNDAVVDPAAAPLRIGIVGEIYVMLEPYINLELHKLLGRMGVEAHSTMLLGDYVRTHIFKNRQALRQNAAVVAGAVPYLGHYVGGHGIKSIGHTVKLGQEGFDGIIHVFPFTCMPEVIAKNILPQVSREAGIPVLSLAFDEQTAAAGLVTRLEAFIDLLEYRKKMTADGRKLLMRAEGEG